MKLESEDLLRANTRKELISIASEKDISLEKTIAKIEYEVELR